MTTANTPNNDPHRTGFANCLFNSLADHLSSDNIMCDSFHLIHVVSEDFSVA